VLQQACESPANNDELGAGVSRAATPAAAGRSAQRHRASDAYGSVFLDGTNGSLRFSESLLAIRPMTACRRPSSPDDAYTPSAARCACLTLIQWLSGRSGCPPRLAYTSDTKTNGKGMRFDEDGVTVVLGCILSWPRGLPQMAYHISDGSLGKTHVPSRAGESRSRFPHSSAERRLCWRSLRSRSGVRGRRCIPAGDAFRLNCRNMHTTVLLRKGKHEATFGRCHIDEPWWRFVGSSFSRTFSTRRAALSRPLVINF
jgi:hypothetical protein